MSGFDSKEFRKFIKNIAKGLEKFVEDFEVTIMDSNFDYPSKDDPNYDYVCETKEENGFLIKSETWTSKKGNKTRTFHRTTQTFTNKEYKETAESLKKQIKEAVKNEDYIKAADLKKKLDDLKE